MTKTKKERKEPKMKTLLEREYDGESIVDLERDMLEAIEDCDVPACAESGIMKGTFKVTITWKEEEEEEE